MLADVRTHGRRFWRPCFYLFERMFTMAKILTGMCVWFDRVSQGDPHRVSFERNAFDDVAKDEIPIYFDHHTRIGTGRISITASGIKYEMEITDSMGGDIQKDILAGKIRGSSLSMATCDYTDKSDSNGPYRSIRRVLSLAEVGPNSNPAERWTDCYINERAVSAPMAVKRPKQRMSIPPMPRSMMNGISMMTAAIHGESVRINGRIISAGTVAMLVANAGPYSIH